jgi:hypothetical protein
LNDLLTVDLRTERKVFGSWGIYIFFILWPFGVLLYAIKNYRAPWAKNIVWLYTIYFGFTFVIPDDGVDASRYADALTMMASSDFSIQTLFSLYTSQESGVLDIAQRLLTFFVSRFTDDYRFLFAAFGFFMGYFLSRIIWYLVDKTVGHFNLFTTLVLISFSLVIGIWDMGGIRWNIAAVIFTFGVMKYLIEGKIGGLWICASTVVVHWSFPLALFVVAVYFFLKNRTTAYFALFLISFFIAELDLEIIRSLFSAYAPQAIQISRGSYLNENYVQYVSERSLTTAWYITGHWVALKWCLFIFASYLYFKGRERFKTFPQLNNLFNFAMLFYGVFNILSVIPSVGRFLTIGNLLILALIFWNLQAFRNKEPYILRLIGIPVMLLFIIVRFRIGFDYIGLWSVIGNPIFIYAAENNISLIDIVKGAL